MNALPPEPQGKGVGANTLLDFKGDITVSFEATTLPGNFGWWRTRLVRLGGGGGRKFFLQVVGNVLKQRAHLSKFFVRLGC